jgi:tRNA A37 N6-isopentenylltransferase MiaA
MGGSKEKENAKSEIMRRCYKRETKCFIGIGGSHFYFSNVIKGKQNVLLGLVGVISTTQMLS